MEPAAPTGQVIEDGLAEHEKLTATLAAARQRADQLALANASLSVRSHLLTVVAESSTRLARATDFDAAVLEVLRRIGETAGLSRVVLLEEKARPGGGGDHVVTAEWCAPGVRSHRECGMEIIPSEAAPEFLALLRRGESFWRPVDEIARPLREVFARLDIRATGCAPLLLDGGYVGAITFDDCISARSWDEAQVDALTAVANAIAAAMQNRRAADELARTNEALRRGVEGLSHLKKLDDFLGEMLLAAAGLAGAQSGGVLLLGPARRTYRLVALLTRDGLVPPATLFDHEIVTTPEFLRWVEAMEQTPAYWPLAPDSPLQEPAARAFHAAQGNRALRHVPMRVGQRLIGWLGLGFADPEPQMGEAHVFLQSLADQMTFAVETLRLSEEARQAAVARERGQAAEQRAAELAKVNEALRGGVARLVEAPDIESILDVWLLDAMRLTGATGGAVLRRVGTTGTEFAFVNVAQGETLTRETLAAEFADTVREVSRRDPVGFFAAMVRGENRTVTTEELAAWYPLGAEYHRRLGNEIVWHMPFRVGGAVAGYLGLAFTHRREPDTVTLRTLEALALQGGMTLELRQKSEEARQLAVARERESAARERAAELVKANEALSRSAAQLVSHEDLGGFLTGVLKEAIRASGAVSGAVFLHDPARDVLSVTALVLRGEALDIARDPRAAAFREPVPAATGAVWKIMGGEKRVFWIDYAHPRPDDWPQSKAWHDAHGHRFVGCIPMLSSGEAIGFLGLAFDQSEVVEPSETRLELCRVLAQQATLAVRLSHLADAAREAAVSRERGLAAEAQAAALAGTNQLLQRSIGRLSLHDSPEDFARPFLEEMYTLLDADSAAQFRVDEEAGTLTGWALYQRGEWMARAEVRQARIADIPAWTEIVADPGQPTFFDLLKPADRARVYPDSVRFLDECGCTWLVNLPLVVGGRVAWVLGVNGHRRGRLTAQNLEIFTTLARQLTLALELHRLGEEAKALAVIREREQAAQERAAELTRTNEAVGDSLSKLVELTDLRAFLRDVFGQCARLTGALGGSLFFHDPAADVLRKQLGWIKGTVVDLADPAAAARYWSEPVPVAAIADWAEIVQIDPKDERVWQGARPWHRAQGYGWLCRVPLKAGTQAIGFLGMAFARREDLSAEKAELICAMSHQIALAVQLDRLAGESKEVALLAERNRIARDLHDVLAQGFVGVLTQVGVLEGALEGDDAQEVERVTERVRVIAREGLEEARRSVHALRPPGRADRLFERLRAILAGLTTGTALQAEATQTGVPAALSDQADWAAVKFAQQALTNTLRYAAADTFGLVFAWDKSGLTLTARDDGVGFDPAAPRAGIGLRAMAERAAECGASLHVESHPGSGTTLRLFLPTTSGSPSSIP